MMRRRELLIGDTLTQLRRLPDGLADCSVTSPPYNKRGQKGGLVAEVVYDGSSDTLPEDEYQAAQSEVLTELYRVTKPGGHCFYNHKLRYTGGFLLHPLRWLDRTAWRVRQEIIWDRGIAGNIRGWRFWPTEERIYWLYKNDPAARPKELAAESAHLTSIWRGRPEQGSDHPAPFPLWLPLRCIYAVLGRGGGLVLDPYLGSGTTAVAAHLLDHDYIGIDRSPSYVSAAHARLASVKDEEPRMWDELRLHSVKRKNLVALPGID